MQYLLIIYDCENEMAERNPQTPEEMEAYMKGWFEVDEALKAAGAYVAGAALEPTSSAKTVRVRDGATHFTDGPFAETAEQLGGYYVIEAKDQQEAAEWAAKLPAAETGSVEVRPIMVLPSRPE